MLRAYCVQSVRTRAVYLSVSPVVGSWPLLLFVTRLHYSLLLPHLLYYRVYLERRLVCLCLVLVLANASTVPESTCLRSRTPRCDAPPHAPSAATRRACLCLCLLFTLTLFVGESTGYSYLSCELLRFVELLVSLRLPHCAEPSH